MAAANEPVTERKISQFREGSLKRKLGIPSIRNAGFCFGRGLGASYFGASGIPSGSGGGFDMMAMVWIVRPISNSNEMAYADAPVA
jgi:hypothetical protein